MNSLNLPKGQSSGQLAVLGAVIGFVVIAITLIIGVRVFSDVEGTINIVDTTANTTATNVINQTYSAFELAAVILVVIVAAVILGVLVRFGQL
tara:strand:- start:3269 stop:3547 length:279 start_codon:yes stop_codon:yes gene_type:complete